jgi:hypothetical protein
LGGCNDQVLAFEGLFFTHMKSNAKYVDNFVLMNDALKLSNRAARTYNTVKLHLHEKLGQSNYACYHFRLGDFTSFCNEVSSHSQDPKYSFFASLLNKGYKCAITVDDLASAMTDLGLPALIMSDDITSIKNKLKNALATASSEWVHQKVAEYLPLGMNEAEHMLMSLLIEQELCAEAEYSCLNSFSTHNK